jgi:TetR/AcrR family transcriptional regulator, repressor for neighboring sulfatase
MPEMTATPSLTTETDKPSGRQAVIEATLRAAARMFAERNPNQVTVREIAAEAGVSHALVHRYLGSKNDILRATLAWERKQTLTPVEGAHSGGELPNFLDPEFAGSLYMRGLMRAVMEGVDLGIRPETVGESMQVLQLLPRFKPSVQGDTRPFDDRVAMAVAFAAYAALANNEDFFITIGCLGDWPREKAHAELDRMIKHIITLGAGEFDPQDV